MVSDEARMKYMTDATFHAYAKTTSKLLIERVMTLNEIQQAVDCAVELYRQAISQQATASEK